MPHYIPQFFKYVSAIEVTNGGTGYNTVPTVTISAPDEVDGIQATATAVVVNEIVTTINVTNGGSGYTSSPTVTIDTSPTGGTDATATSSIRIAVGSPSDYTKTYKRMSKYSLPEFIREDYTAFTTFIEKYFEYMDQSGKPGNLLFNTHYFDIDDLDAIALNKRALELARDFPQVLEVDKHILYKHIKTLYEAKGSERAIKAYFKLVYNEDVEVSYPTNFLLRTNDGTWRQKRSIKTVAGYNGYDSINLVGREIDIYYYSTANYFVEADEDDPQYGYRLPNTVLSKITASVQEGSKIVFTTPQSYELKLSFTENVTEIPGPGDGATASLTIEDGVVTATTFDSGETDATRTTGVYRNITGTTSGSGSGATFTISVSDAGVAIISSITEGGKDYALSDTITLAASNFGSGATDDIVLSVSNINDGQIKSVSVTNAGTGYTAAPTVVITDTGTGANAHVTANISNGGIQYFTVNSGGSNYTSGTASVSFDVSALPTFVVLRGEDPTEANKKATLKRVLNSISAGTYSGSESDVGFRVGQAFKIAEGSTEGTWARVKSVNSYNIPQTWTIISPGEGWTSATGTDTVTSRTGEDITVSFTTKYLFDYDGRFIGTRGQLSEKNRLNDNRKYQIYSYIIQSTLTQSIWDSGFRKHMHPAGKEVFGDIVVSATIQPSVTYSVPDGLSVFKFITEEVVTVLDPISIVMYWVREFTETVTITDLPVVSYSLVPTEETVDAEEGTLADYVVDDYWHGFYTQTGFVEKIIGKVLIDTPLATEILVPVLSWYRDLSDIGTMSDVVDIVNFKYVDFTDSVQNITEFLDFGFEYSDTATTDDTGVNFVFDFGKNVSDSTTTSQSTVINIEKIINDPTILISTPSASEQVSILTTWSRSFTDSGTISETVDILKFVQNTQTDSVTVAQTSTLLISKVFNDAVSTEDAASLDDENEVFVGKRLTETLSATETIISNLSKTIPTESATMTDSGVITFAQDYIDPTYLATPDDYLEGTTQGTF